MMERRTIAPHLAVTEHRADASRRIVGYTAIFHELSEDLGGFRERIAPGAFAETIANDDIRALFNHDPSLLLGRNRAGSLSLREDAHGLAFIITPGDSQLARDVMLWIKRLEVTGCSFGFRTPPGGDEWSIVDGGNVRTLTKVRLYDVGPVTFPAYPQTDVTIPSARTRAAAPVRDAWRRKLALLA